MKKNRWFGLLICLVLALAAGLAAAEGAGQEIVPKEITEDEVDLENGTFRLTIEDTDKIISDGYFTALSTQQNQHLLTMSMALALASMEIGGDSYITALLNDIGYTDIQSLMQWVMKRSYR